MVFYNKIYILLAPKCRVGADRKIRFSFYFPFRSSSPLSLSCESKRAAGLLRHQYNGPASTLTDVIEVTLSNMMGGLY
jgi:hypothetical protein